MQTEFLSRWAAGQLCWLRLPAACYVTPRCQVTEGQTTGADFLKSIHRAAEVQDTAVHISDWDCCMLHCCLLDCFCTPSKPSLLGHLKALLPTKMMRRSDLRLQQTPLPPTRVPPACYWPYCLDLSYMLANRTRSQITSECAMQTCCACRSGTSCPRTSWSSFRQSSASLMRSHRYACRVARSAARRSAKWHPARQTCCRADQTDCFPKNSQTQQP